MFMFCFSSRMLLPSFPITMMFIVIHLYTDVLVYCCLLFGLIMLLYFLFMLDAYYAT